MSETVAFKVILRAEKGNQREVRRFTIDKDVSTTFIYLQGKVTTVFPDLENKLFNITWKDADGDLVTIEGNEDLTIALNEMVGDVNKIFVTVKGEKPTDDITEQSG